MLPKKKKGLRNLFSIEFSPTTAGNYHIKARLFAQHDLNSDVRLAIFVRSGSEPD